MSGLQGRFGECEVCGARDWHEAYRGPVRRGSFGNLSDVDTVVALCGSCGIGRLQEDRCEQGDVYEDADYRKLVGEATDPAGYFARHDPTMLRNLNVLWPESLRGKTVADIGCAAGSFLDHVRGLVAGAVAVEPCEIYHQSLAERGYATYGYPPEAVKDWAGKVDYVFSFSVIEHVPDARSFLENIRQLLKPGGRALISTPNRRDAMLDLLPGVYDAFFYRTVHRWYFDADSLQNCAKAAGLLPLETHFVHRFGLSNCMRWLRDRQPGEREALPHLDSPLLDGVWSAFLQERGVSDYLYLTATRPSHGE